MYVDRSALQACAIGPCCGGKEDLCTPSSWMDAELMLLYVAGGAEGVRLCGASLCCKEERADFCLFGAELSSEVDQVMRKRY